MSLATILAHVGGVPVEEALAAGVAAGGAGLRAAALYLRRRPAWWRSRRAPGDRAGTQGQKGEVG